MYKLSENNYESFLRRMEYTVVLLDASWDVGPGGVIRPRFEEAARAFDGRVGFGEVNCDECVFVARSVGIVSVPTVAYYKGGQLIVALVGSNQNIIARTQAMMDGMWIGRKDGRDWQQVARARFPTGG